MPKWSHSFPLRIAFALMLALGPLLSLAQSVTSLATNGDTPALRATEITDEFIPVRIAFQGQSDGMNNLWFMSMQSLATPNGAMQPQTVFKLIEAYWTKGEERTVAGHTFQLFYKIDMIAGLSELQPLTTQTPAQPDLKIFAPYWIREDAITMVGPVEGVAAKDVRSMFVADSGARVAAKRTANLSNLKQVGLALLMYSADSDDLLPAAQSTTQVVSVTAPYLKDLKIWVSPNPNSKRYQFNMNLSGVASMDIETLTQVPMVYDAKPWPDGSRAVCFADGHAKICKPEEWPEIEKQLKRKFPRNGRMFAPNYAQMAYPE